MLSFWISLLRAKDDGGRGDNWSLQNMQSSSQIVTTNKPTPNFLQAGWPSCRPTNSVIALKGKVSYSTDLLTPSSPGVFQPSLWPLEAPGYLTSRLPSLSSALWRQYLQNRITTCRNRKWNSVAETCNKQPPVLSCSIQDTTRHLRLAVSAATLCRMRGSRRRSSVGRKYRKDVCGIDDQRRSLAVTRSHSAPHICREKKQHALLQQQHSHSGHFSRWTRVSRFFWG